MALMKSFTANATNDGNNTVLAGVAGRSICITALSLSHDNAAAQIYQVWSAATVEKWRGRVPPADTKILPSGTQAAPLFVLNVGEGLLIVNPVGVDCLVSGSYFIQ